MSDYELSPDRKQQNIKSIFRRLVQNPVQIRKIPLIRRQKIVVEERFFSCGISHLDIPLRIQRHDLKHGKSLAFSLFHKIGHVVPLHSLRHRPCRIGKPHERCAVRIGKIPAVFRYLQFFHCHFLLYHAVTKSIRRLVSSRSIFLSAILRPSADDMPSF